MNNLQAKPNASRKSSFSKRMNPHHIKAVRAIGYALMLKNADAWLGLIPVLVARLTAEERAALSFATLKSLDRDNAQLTVDAALGSGAGRPIAPFFNHMDEAAFWADMADPEELAAYALASFNAMPRGRQAAFLDYVQGRQAA